MIPAFKSSQSPEGNKHIKIPALLSGTSCLTGTRSALWGDRAGATEREALNMFSVKMWTSLKMCCSGSGGQVDVIIFLLERGKKKKKLEVNFSTAIIQSWD